MDQKRIVITGIGVVAPNGIGKEEFWANCRAGVSGIKPITLFDTSDYRCHHAGEISNFQPEKYLGPKGLRNLDRTTLLALVASKLALDDAKLAITDKNAHEIGVVLGSTMGSVHSISTFDIEGLREGPRYVNPALFPNTVINSPASQISIRFGIKGLNSTIGTGFTASLNAIEYAVDMLESGRIQAILVGGVEELCVETFNGFYQLGLLQSSRASSLESSTASVGTMMKTWLGEGAGMLLLENEERAISRGASGYGEIVGVSSIFEDLSAARLTITETAASSVIKQVLGLVNITAQDIERVYSSSGLTSADSSGDHEETRALAKIFGPILENLPRFSVKSLIGECFSTMGILELIAALDARTNKKNAATLLINTFSPIGLYASVVVRSHPLKSYVKECTSERKFAGFVSPRPFLE